MSEGGGYARERGEGVKRGATMCVLPCAHSLGRGFVSLNCVAA